MQFTKVNPEVLQLPARNENGKSQTSEFCSRNPVRCFSVGVYCLLVSYFLSLLAEHRASFGLEVCIP